MAAPNKSGLDYFPHDVDLSHDNKIEYIEAKHGLVGYAIFNKLLEKIYHNSYYCSWSQRDAIIFSKHNNIDVNDCINVVNDCINEGLFDKSIYKKHNILTSKSIQNRYFTACSRRRKINAVWEYLLVKLVDSKEKAVNGNIYVENVNINSLNDNIKKQIEIEIESNNINNINTAFQNQNAVVKDDPEIEFYLTKKKRKLQGQKLEDFKLFWEKFNYSHGKADAADAWLDINHYTPEKVKKIHQEAEKEAHNRKILLTRGQTPKMAQGWLNGKRWEDELTLLEENQNGKKYHNRGSPKHIRTKKKSPEITEAERARAYLINSLINDESSIKSPYQKSNIWLSKKQIEFINKDRELIEFINILSDFKIKLPDSEITQSNNDFKIITNKTLRYLIKSLV